MKIASISYLGLNSILLSINVQHAYKLWKKIAWSIKPILKSSPHFILESYELQTQLFHIYGAFNIRSLNKRELLKLIWDNFLYSTAKMYSVGTQLSRQDGSISTHNIYFDLETRKMLSDYSPYLELWILYLLNLSQLYIFVLSIYFCLLIFFLVQFKSLSNSGPKQWSVTPTTVLPLAKF